MADIPNNSSTTATVSVNGSVTGELETKSDHDWYRVELVAGQTYTIFLDGVTLEDPYLYIRNSSGAVVVDNDDISAGEIRDSRITFTASYTGTYFLDVGAWNEDYTGTYELIINPQNRVFTNDQIANELASGHWNGDVHRFNVAPGGTLTVNLTGLTPAGQNLARQALALWSDIIGVTFTEVGTGGQLVFEDDDPQGAYSEGHWANGIISQAFINVPTGWLTDYGTTLNSYSFQTYLHEIGHALGLGHSGPYNGQATYPNDVLYANDSWATSVMSYFDQQESTYFGSQGFTVNFVLTPMAADILAMSLLYGLSTTTRTGDTIYGFGSNAGRAVFDAGLNPTAAYTIYDSGGIDTLDYSGFSVAQRINLNPETFSNVGGSIGNVTIARGVTIENAKTGSGNDTLIGNGAANRLDSGAGNDTLRGEGGDDWLIPGWGNNTVDGGAGIDTVDYVWGMQAFVDVNLALGTAANQGGAGQDTLISIENVRGSHYDDIITGNSAANVLEGHFGRDIINGGDGADTLIGDSPESTIGYDDTLTGGLGSDTLIGGGGMDTAFYSSLFHNYQVQLNGAAGSVAGGVEGGTDTLTSIEFVQFLDGKFVFDPDGVAAQVTRLYDTVLQRGPDQGGLDNWVDRIEDAGATLKDVATGFLHSAEFQAKTGHLSNEDYVEFLYVNALGRPSDPEGKAHWVAQLENGADRADLLVGFSESLEHRNLTVDLVAEGFFNTDDVYQAVALLYDSFANRLPDAGGLISWAEAIKSGAMTLDQAADAFANSAEFQNRTAGMSNSELVEFMYWNTLDRAPDPAGFAHWTNALDAGMDRGDLLMGFSQSAEHTDLFAAHITYGIDYLI